MERVNLRRRAGGKRGGKSWRERDEGGDEREEEQQKVEKGGADKLMASIAFHSKISAAASEGKKLGTNRKYYITKMKINNADVKKNKKMEP